MLSNYITLIISNSSLVHTSTAVVEQHVGGLQEVINKLIF